MVDIQKIYNSLIVAFLNRNKAISVNYIENKLSIPIGTISRALNGHAPIPKKFIYELICEFAKYGMKLDDYILEYDELTNTLFGTKFVKQIASYEVITDSEGKEHRYLITENEDDNEEGKAEGATHFEYEQVVYKNMWTCYEDLN